MPTPSPFVPFDFEQRRKQDTTIGEVRTFDPVSDVVGRMREAEQPANFTDTFREFRSQLFGRDPQKEARVTRLSRQVGEPPALIEGREDTFDRYLRASAFQRSVATNPELSRFFGNNPRYAVAASDDAKSVGLVGQGFADIERPKPSLWSWLNGMGVGFVGGGKQMWQGYQLYRQDNPFATPGALGLGNNPGALLPFLAPDEYRRMVRETEPGRRAIIDRYTATQSEIDAATPGYDRNTFGGKTMLGLYQGAVSMAQMLPGIAASIAMRSPYPAIGAAALQSGLPAYAKYRARGATVAEAQIGATIEGGAEAAGEVLPALYVARRFGRAGGGNFLTEFLIRDMAGEQATTLVQDAADTAIANPNKTWGDYLAERPDAAYQTALGVLVMSGTMGGTNHVVRKFVEAGEARANAANIDRLGRAAEASELRKNDPEAYNEMIRHMAEKSGTPHVFIPADAVREYMQSDSYDPYNDPFEDYRDQVDEAYETGGDVVLPAEFVLGTLPGTPAWAAVKADIRLSSGGVSEREADVYDENMDAVEAELEKLAKDGATGKVEELTQSLQEKLQDAGFTPYVARQQATLMVNRIVTRAARLGNDVTGAEGDYLDIRQVLPPELAKARAADTLDLVINALRKGGEATKQSGQSLLEFIAARGGIEDRGGDIASMGGDRWHRAEPFRKKLLKKFDAAQGSIIGSEYNPNTINAMFDAAVSAGYFPDLLVQREEGSGYSDALDANAFIDAIGAELAGNPRYAEEAQTDDFRAAADELRQALSERGLDPEGLSDAELRAVIAQMGQEMDAGGFEQLGDTIEIDGVARPTRNSEGQQIAGTEEGVRAFWAWFGDSKVVDDQGRPLVVYHGTTASFDQFKTDGRWKTEGAGAFFTSDPEVAGTYVAPQRGEVDAAPQIYPVYLALDNMPVVDFEGSNWNNGPRFYKVAVNGDSDVSMFESKAEAEDYASELRADISEQDGADIYGDDPVQIIDYGVKLNEDGFLEIEWDSPDSGTSTDGLAIDARIAGFDGLKLENVKDHGGRSLVSDRAAASDIYVAMRPEQIKSINNRGTFDPADPRILYQAAPSDDAAFEAWAGVSREEVIDPEDINDFDFSGPGPFVLRAFHGTTHEFEAFDASLRGNKEGQFGAVNYFTSSESDAEANYAGEGPDLTQRIELRAEQIEQEADGEIDMAEARKQARAELAGGTQQTLEVYIRTDKPFIVGSEDSPWIEFTDFEALERKALERVADDEGVTVEEIEANRDDYEDQIDEARWDIESEEPDALFEAVQKVAARYDLDAQEIYGQVSDTGVISEGTRQSQLEDILRKSEGLAYAEDPETGGLIGYHVLGDIIRELGFDSIILKNASERFKTMDMEQGTAHIQVFDEHRTNIKSINNRGTFDPADPRILYQRTGIDLSAGGGSKSISIGDATVEYGVSSNGETAEVILVSVPKAKRRGGAARKAMQEFLAATDAAGLTVFLTAHPMGKGGASKTALEKFYKSLGFVENKGRNKDFRAMQGMVRQPPRILYQSAYHGSPHIFDRFSLDKIGTGEGAQAYGWGLYFAGRKEIAEHYREVLSGKWTPKMESAAAKALGVGVGIGYETPVLTALTMGGSLEGFRADLERHAALGATKTSSFAQKETELIRAGLENGKLDAFYRQFEKQIKGRTYTVEIPEDDEYLLWDKPLSEQPEKVRAALIDALPSSDGKTPLRDVVAQWESGGLNPEKMSEFREAGYYLYKQLSDILGSDRAASEALHNAGIAGIKYLDGGSRSQGDGSFNYVVFDDSRVSIQAYEQSYGDGPRGRIQFIPDGRSIIELFKDRNLSTLLHELGHDYLEQLRADAPQSEQLTSDLQAVYDWFKTNGHEVTDGVIPVEAHELWARGFERYLMEGKAPSQGLQRIFETFRGWLMAIYKKVAALRSPITPEIREVMDRLLATDEEIAAMREQQMLEPLFKDAASIGMTEAEFQAYTDDIARSRHAASGALLEKTMAAIRARETKRYKEARAEVEREVADQVDNAPMFRAIRHMKAGKVDAVWLEREYGLDAKAMLPKGTVKEGGLHPDAIAEISGFDSGKQMIEAVMGAEAQHRQLREEGDKRSMRDRAIQTATDTEMNRRYGDPLSDGSIEREALAAVHSEKQGEVFAAEARALARKTGQRPTPYRMARDWARRKVREGVYQTEASAGAIQRHQRNVAKAGREAEKAMLAGKFEDALRFKQQQMVSSALLAEAKLANDEVEAARKRLDKIARKATSKSIDQGYLDQAHALLEQVDLRPRSQKSIDRQGKWEAWAAEREAEGFDIVVPASFEATLGQQNWSRLPVETLLALDAAVTQVVHLGRMKQRLLDGKEARDFDALVKEARDGAANINGKPPKGLDEPGFWDAIRARAAGTDAALLKMETVFDWLDGGNSNGVFNRVVFRPIGDAQANEADMVADYLGRIKALFEALPGETVQRWSDKVQTPFVDPFNGKPYTPTRQRLIAMALNIGNEGNMQRLADGYGWNAGAIEAFLTSELTAEEWQFVQGVWDTIETLWPEIEAMERRVNGVPPDKVEAREIVTPHGTFRGGYYPAAYDSTLNLKAEARAGRESDLFESGYTRASTRSSATKARADQVRAPILLDLGVINRHLSEVIHDITHREVVMQANKFLTSERVMKVVDEALGQEIRKQFRPWLKFVANSWAMERAGNEGFGKWLGQLRANTTAVGMGLRATTMVSQIAGYSNSIEVVGEKWIAEAIARSSASPIDTYRFVMERSGEVRHRMDTLDRDIRTELARLSASNPVSRAARQALDAKRFFFHGIGYMDRMVSIPTWLGAYNKGLAEGMTEEEAAYAGDKAVRLSQGAGAPKDLAAIQRGTGKWGEALKLFTMFYTFLSAQYQRQRTLARDIGGADKRKSRSVPRLAARAFWLMVVPPLMIELIRYGLGAGKPPEDDEWWSQWLARKMLSNALGPIPVVRDLFEPSWNAMRGSRSFSPEFSPVNRFGETVVNALGDIGKITRGEETKSATKNVLEATGYVTGLVPGQVASSVQFLVDVGSGDADPRNMDEWREGLVTGKIKDE